MFVAAQNLLLKSREDELAQGQWLYGIKSDESDAPSSHPHERYPRTIDSFNKSTFSTPRIFHYDWLHFYPHCSTSTASDGKFLARAQA